MFDCYLEISGEIVVIGTDVSLAIAEKLFHRFNRRGYIKFIHKNTGFTYHTLEELKNVKNIRSQDRIRSIDVLSSEESISEDSDRELPEPITNNSESSSERDNKWDKFPRL